MRPLLAGRGAGGRIEASKRRDPVARLGGVDGVVDAERRGALDRLAVLVGSATIFSK